MQSFVVALRHRVDDGDDEVGHHDDDDLLENGGEETLRVLSVKNGQGRSGLVVAPGFKPKQSLLL